MGQPIRAMLAKRRLAEAPIPCHRAARPRNARRKPEPPSMSKGYPVASHAAGWSTDQHRSRKRRAFRPPHIETDAECSGISAGHERREVEGDVRSTGVLMNVIECKKHRESSLGTSWHWISNSPTRPLAATLGSATRRVRDLDSGRREGEVIFAWKRGSHSLSRA